MQRPARVVAIAVSALLAILLGYGLMRAFASQPRTPVQPIELDPAPADTTSTTRTKPTTTTPATRSTTTAPEAIVAPTPTLAPVPPVDDDDDADDPDADDDERDDDG